MVELPTRWMKGALEVVRLSLREICEGNLEERVLLYWGPWRMCKGRLWRRTSLSIGVPLGNLEGGSYTGDFERRMKESSRNEASLSDGTLLGQPGGGAPLLGTPKVMLSEALEMGACFHCGPALRERGGTLLS
jgi:hypothetical protein